MKNNIPCEVINDLFPLYIDELTSEETNRQIENHILECEDCRKTLESMQYTSGEELANSKVMDAAEKKEIDFLKATKKKNKKAIAGAVAGVIVVFAIAILLVQYVFGFNEIIDPDRWNVSVNDDQVNITGEPANNKLYVKDCAYELSDGILKVSTKCARKIDTNRKTTEFSYALTEGENRLKEIYIDGSLVWQDGVRITEKALAVFNSKHPYMGDAVANIDTAQALGISNTVGAFTNELESTEEPYVWRIVFSKKTSPTAYATVAKKCEAYGCILLATIDNLDEVEFVWNYNDKSDFISCRVTKDGPESGNFSMDDLTVKDLKEAGKTPASLQRLMDELGIN